MLEIAFEVLKNIFNTKKAHLKEKSTNLVKKLKTILRVKKT
jgi:hypothetical protein